MNKKRVYSSSLMKFLLEDNEKWNFWTPDWSKKILVQWPGKIPLKRFRDEIKKLLNTDEFIYERSLSGDDSQYVVNSQGVLIDIDNAMYEQSI